MSIDNFPASLQPIIQQNMLEREFEQGLRSVLVYRDIADKEIFPNAIGETITKTRVGLKAPVETPLNPTQNTNLDNGLTPTGWTVEQYTLSINMYGDTIDLNTLTQKVGIEKQFLQNALTNGIQAAQSLNRISRNALFNAYLSGNTRVTATLGSPNTTISVDDVRGFRHVLVNGVLTSVSANVTMSVTVGSNVYTLVGFTQDVTNVSTAPNGISGTLTFSSNVSTSDGTANNAVVGQFAPTILRPNARSTSKALLTTDLMTMQLIMDSVTVLRNNAVPTINGRYNCYLDNVAARQLFADPEFQLLFRGEYKSEEYRYLDVIELLDIRFIRTTEAYQQTLGSVHIHRPIVCGSGTLVEGTFAGLLEAGQEKMGGGGLIDIVDSVAQITREPLDRLKQIISQSWYWVGGYTVPTDQTANQNIIPTSNSSYYKRAVVLEVGGAS